MATKTHRKKTTAHKLALPKKTGMKKKNNRRKTDLVLADPNERLITSRQTLTEAKERLKHTGVVLNDSWEKKSGEKKVSKGADEEME